MVSLADAYVIGQGNFEQWSQGFASEGYLKVLPHPDEKVPFKDPFQDWQNGVPGNYFSSWGPEEELVATITLSDLAEINIDGFGTLQSGDGLVSWLNNAATPYEFLRGYNGTIPGPMLITEPGDTLKIQLVNDLSTPAQATNFHTHGLHVSAVGNGDNVLFSLPAGETWDIEVKIPDDHFLGTAWYHPHLHGQTNEQIASGLGSFLIVNPPHDLPDLDKWNPTEKPMYFMAIQSLGVQQVNRPGQAGDPLNQNPNVALPAGTPLSVLGTTPEGKPIYEMSDALFVGYNAKPIAYDPTQPLGSAPALQPYGGGGLAEPVENVIHTVNGQYNPTIETETGQWELFTFANMSVNSFHVLQLVKEEGDQLIPQEVSLVAVDGDISGRVDSIRREVTELPLLNPGSRVAFEHWFDAPGTYYLLSNGTEELLGENTSELIGNGKGFSDGHLIWGSQVLATLEVTGETVPTGTIPQAYDVLVEQSEEINQLVQGARGGDFDKERTFVWDANIGGALANGNTPDDLDVITFEGTYTINGEYFSTDGTSMPPLTMPMLGTKEVWNIRNRSGQIRTDLPEGVPNIPLLEWHPFHIHQNDFIVLEINGLPIEDIEQNYLAGVLTDTFGLSPTYAPGSVTAQNPYGTPMYGGETSEVKILMNFQDFPGSYVNHCHILFHEDAGMMAAVRVILNTDDTWMGTSSQAGDADIELFRGSALGDSIRITPYGENFTGGIDVAIADVNFLQDFTNHNVTDNVTDVVTIQKSLNGTQQNFQVKLFDGKTLFDKLAEGQRFFDGQNQDILITEFTPFQNVNVTAADKASVTTADMNGDGFSDIIVGISGGVAPLIEVYSGQDFQLLGRISPFHHSEGFSGSIHLAGGDVNGDNFEDIIVSGGGSLELYSGILLDGLLRDGVNTTENGRDTAHAIAILEDAVKPYGDSYTGEIEVTSGYILQTPFTPNGKPVQTNNANITTMALETLPQGEEKIKVHTFIGGYHTGHETMDTTEATTTPTATSPLRVDFAFTPEQNITTLSGTFADIPTGDRGSGVLLTQTAAENHEIIYLQEENIAETLAVNSPPTLQAVNIEGVEDQEVIFTTPIFATVFDDEDDDNLQSIKVITLPAAGNLTLNGVVVTAGQDILADQLGNLRYSPIPNANGEVIFTITGSDGIGNSEEANVNITLAAVNDAPAFTLIDNPNQVFASNQVISIPSFASNIRKGADNEAEQELRFSVEVTGDDIFAELPTLDPTTGTLSYTLGNVQGTATVNVTLSDNGGVANGGEDTSTTQTFTVRSLKNLVEEVFTTDGNNNIDSFAYDATPVLGSTNIITNLANHVRDLGADAEFDNLVGLYPIVGMGGGIDTNGDGNADLLPGDEGYARAAIESRITNFRILAGASGNPNFNTTVEQFGDVLLKGGQMYAPFVIAHGGDVGFEGFIANEDAETSTFNNPAEFREDLVAYFAFIGANPDKVSHIRHFAEGLFGFEDLPSNLGRSDNDFNDAVFRLVFTV